MIRSARRIFGGIFRRLVIVHPGEELLRGP
jgi:hypothetical protein